MQLFLASRNEDDARKALAEAILRAAAPAQARLAAVRALWDASPGAFALVSQIAGAADPRARSVADWARVFDAAATISPEGSVALYSFGRADLLEGATEELVGYLDAHALVDGSSDILEIGCGIGRMAGPLACRAASYTGVDVSAVMLAEARRRVDAPNVRFRQGNGRDLAALSDGAADLVLAVDVFPYLVAAGAEVVAGNLREIARALRPGGRALIFNYSYRGDEERDRVELTALAEEVGLAVERVERPLRIWDGLLFALRKGGDD